MKSVFDRLSTVNRVLKSMEESDKRLKASRMASDVMSVLIDIKNPYVKARLVLAHLRRNPNSKVGNHQVYSRVKAEATIRQFGAKANTVHNKSLFARINRRIQNIETKEGII